VLPVWQGVVKPFVESGRLVVVGVVQEQHPERARLYAQWRKLDWPIFVDSLNLLDMEVVPVPVAIDEWGVVRHESIWPHQFVKDFFDVEYPRPDESTTAPRPVDPDVEGLRAAAERDGTAESWRALADALYLHGGDSGLNGAIDAYRRAVDADSTDSRARFRLGVAYRRRFESADRQLGDAQLAVEQWGTALSLNPNQYIWRRRIQQYGPRLDKPYNFYFWVDQARKDIRARGETPVTLSVEPAGSELAPPLKGGDGENGGAVQPASVAPACAESTAGLHRDDRSFVIIDTIVTPARVPPGQHVRARIVLRLNPKTKPYWNNEARDLVVCAELPDGLSLGEGMMTFPNPPEAETQEDRFVEFELHVPKTAADGAISIPAQSLYHVCENRGGKCRYLRQDFTIQINVDKNAPGLR